MNAQYAPVSANVNDPHATARRMGVDVSDRVDLIDHCLSRWGMQIASTKDGAEISIENSASVEWDVAVRRDAHGDVEAITLSLLKDAEVRQFAQGFRWLADRLEKGATVVDGWAHSSFEARKDAAGE